MAKAATAQPQSMARGVAAGVLRATSARTVTTYSAQSQRTARAVMAHTSTSRHTPRTLQWLSQSWSRRLYSTQYQQPQFSRGDNKATAIYATAWIIMILGFSYAAVPLYRAFCQAWRATGYGGTVNKHDNDKKKVEDMVPVEDRQITVRFNADTSATMPWSFKPQQKAVTVVPGETALAFFTASNPTDEAITGISTYNVVPFEAGQYFNKIQCFCFEEQRLNPNEEVDMPVFFYIDPEFAEDPNLMRINDITLSYTFFKSTSTVSPIVPPEQRQLQQEQASTA
ncbi:cytochrome c oxidase assembly protein COX11 [Salpingoeca rosetta]|uniref:Cytochrome c oxidase assembly protein COX11 n=1 Tax=Salpingoeca rosetta (strain ATCC 50818 / BSB-021) TaxID=946362 RepID=F2UNB5_SALR5|nr:cytochrome c oxidase assembly protein COX11 [Salpingoeca rosetta]EGD79120.1 cytochrome c oxidase assembly protein COX11 [Salpingoeca rosetta]|eukprot:XP_004989205.1 cytochrome c oxidase assembly protein COX11 [Salpingoeca rosetta]